ncbi:MAG: hypothetical protein PHQ40_16725, partial [Anaerolineaceae bacterium]|nr:hypothetical protein [Anaerolineaceae bacterium]
MRTSPYPVYHVHLIPTIRLILAALTCLPRSFQQDSRHFLQGCSQIKVIGVPPDLNCYEHGLLVTFNHYFRPGFDGWWLGFALASILPADFKLVITSAHTFSGHSLRTWLQTPFSRFYLRKVAQVYGFLSMPPMPPRPWESQDRFLAVRHLLNYARNTSRPLIGFAPEGGDTPDGCLSQPFPGVGRLMGLLARIGLSFQPVGIYESQGSLCLNFGQPYRLEPELMLTTHDSDESTSTRVMRA